MLKFLLKGYTIDRETAITIYRYWWKNKNIFGKYPNEIKWRKIWCCLKPEDVNEIFGIDGILYNHIKDFSTLPDIPDYYELVSLLISVKGLFILSDTSSDIAKIEVIYDDNPIGEYTIGLSVPSEAIASPPETSSIRDSNRSEESRPPEAIKKGVKEDKETAGGGGEGIEPGFVRVEKYNNEEFEEVVERYKKYCDSKRPNLFVPSTLNTGLTMYCDYCTTDDSDEDCYISFYDSC